MPQTYSVWRRLYDSMKWIPKIASRNWDTCLCSNHQTILIITFFRKIKEVVCRIKGYQAFVFSSYFGNIPKPKKILIGVPVIDNFVWIIKGKFRYIALSVFSGSIKKLFSIDCVNIYLFSILFFNKFFLLEKLVLSHIADIVIH